MLIGCDLYVRVSVCVCLWANNFTSEQFINKWQPRSSVMSPNSEFSLSFNSAIAEGALNAGSCCTLWVLLIVGKFATRRKMLSARTFCQPTARQIVFAIKLDKWHARPNRVGCKWACPMQLKRLPVSLQLQSNVNYITASSCRLKIVTAKSWLSTWPLTVSEIALKLLNIVTAILWAPGSLQNYAFGNKIEFVKRHK